MVEFFAGVGLVVGYLFYSILAAAAIVGLVRGSYMLWVICSYLYKRLFGLLPEEGFPAK